MRVLRYLWCLFSLCGGVIYVDDNGAYWRCTSCGKVHR